MQRRSEEVCAAACEAAGENLPASPLPLKKKKRGMKSKIEMQMNECKSQLDFEHRGWSKPNFTGEITGKRAA